MSKSTAKPNPAGRPKPPACLRKTLCDWSKKELREQAGELFAIVAKPRFVCLKCGRVASGKRWVCKPRALAAISPGKGGPPGRCEE